MHKTDIPTLIGALRILSREIQSGDGIANMAIAEAADRMEEMQEHMRVMREALGVVQNESHQHYRCEEFTEANDHFRNCYMYACDALERVQPNPKPVRTSRPPLPHFYP